MVEQKYIELINRDIDKNLSPEEKTDLTDYLENNLEAFKLHNDLKETEKLLDRLPDQEPSVNLSNRIMSSIDINRYSKPKEIKKHLHISTAFYRKRLSISFAFGMISGILLLAAVFYSSLSSQIANKNIFGTIGAEKSAVLSKVDVNTGGINGKIQISEALNSYLVDINLASSKEYYLDIRLDDNESAICDVKINEKESSPHSILFPVKSSSNNRFIFTLYSGDSKILEREVRLN